MIMCVGMFYLQSEFKFKKKKAMKLMNCTQKAVFFKVSDDDQLEKERWSLNGHLKKLSFKKND